MYNVDRPTPIGCIVGMFAIPFIVASGFCFRGVQLALTMEPPRKDAAMQLTIWGLCTALPALVCVGYCLYRFFTTGDRKYEEYGRSLSS
jgi:hypothetical protein